MIRLGNRLFHPLHVLGFRLEQPAHVVSRRGLYGPGSATEVTAETFAEVQEPLTDPGQQPNLGISGRAFLTLPAVLFMRYLIKPCLLIRNRLSSFIDNNQIDESDKVELIMRRQGDLVRVDPVVLHLAAVNRLSGMALS